MWSSGTAARRRTAHLMVTARLGYSMTSGPASHSTIVSAPIGELYDVHSTRMAAPNFAIFSGKLVVPRSRRIVYIPATGTPLQNPPYEAQMYQLLWMLAALKQQPAAAQAPAIASVKVEPAEVALEVGDTVRLAATAQDSAGRPVRDVVVRWFQSGGHFEGKVD